MQFFDTFVFLKYTALKRQSVNIETPTTAGKTAVLLNFIYNPFEKIHPKVPAIATCLPFDLLPERLTGIRISDASSQNKNCLELIFEQIVSLCSKQDMIIYKAFKAL